MASLEERASEYGKERGIDNRLCDHDGVIFAFENGYRAAIADAAKVCDKTRPDWHDEKCGCGECVTAFECRDAIRKLAD